MRLKTRRKFDQNGRAREDLDVKHGDHKNGDHAHRFNGTKRGGPENLTKKEKIELEKAKKKRKFYKK